MSDSFGEGLQMTNNCGARLDLPAVEALLKAASRREAALQEMQSDGLDTVAHELRSTRHQVGLCNELIARLDAGNGTRPAPVPGHPCEVAPHRLRPAPGSHAQNQTRILVRLAQVIDSLSERAIGLELSLGTELLRERCPRMLDEELRTTYLSLASLRKRRACVERELGLGDEASGASGEPPPAPPVAVQF